MQTPGAHQANSRRNPEPSRNKILPVSLPRREPRQAPASTKGAGPRHSLAAQPAPSPTTLLPATNPSPSNPPSQNKTRAKRHQPTTLGSQVPATTKGAGPEPPFHRTIGNQISRLPGPSNLTCRGFGLLAASAPVQTSSSMRLLQPVCDTLPKPKLGNVEWHLIRFAAHPFFMQQHTLSWLRHALPRESRMSLLDMKGAGLRRRPPTHTHTNFGGWCAFGAAGRPCPRSPAQTHPPGPCDPSVDLAGAGSSSRSRRSRGGTCAPLQRPLTHRDPFAE